MAGEGTPPWQVPGPCSLESNQNTHGLQSSALTKELEALCISPNCPVKVGDLRIHIKQEEIEARRLATYPDFHANTAGRAGSSQCPIYPRPMDWVDSHPSGALSGLPGLKALRPQTFPLFACYHALNFHH